MQAAEMLAEIEDVLRTMPPRSTIRQQTSENFAWFGRVLAVIELWKPLRAVAARSCLKQFHGVLALDANQAYAELMIILNEARSDLRMTTLGPVNTAIGHGFVFDYFDEIRKLVEIAKTDLFFVDPYLDAEFVSRYLPNASSGITIRLLAREKLATLVPAVQMFAQQSNAKIELRSTSRLHDRFLFIDGQSCYQSGASFKDGAKNAPTTITQVTDAFSSVRQTYEDLWSTAKIEI